MVPSIERFISSRSLGWDMASVDRPAIGDYDSFGDYRSAFIDYACARFEDDTADPHHLQEYPLVRECPTCGGVAVVSLISVVDNPVWICKTGRHTTASNATFYRDDFE